KPSPARSHDSRGFRADRTRSRRPDTAHQARNAGSPPGAADRMPRDRPVAEQGPASRDDGIAQQADGERIVVGGVVAPDGVEVAIDNENFATRTIRLQHLAFGCRVVPLPDLASPRL